MPRLACPAKEGEYKGVVAAGVRSDTHLGGKLRTPIAFRAVAALALATGLSAAGVTAAFAVDIPAPCLAILDPAARQDCIDQAAQAGGGVDVGGGAGQAGGGDSTGSTGGETSSGGST